MTDAKQKYRALREKLYELRRGSITPDEDADIRGEMFDYWWQMTKEEQDVEREDIKAIALPSDECPFIQEKCQGIEKLASENKILRAEIAEKDKELERLQLIIMDASEASETVNHYAGTKILRQEASRIYADGLSGVKTGGRDVYKSHMETLC